jgi:hypothetical protein
MKSIYPFMVLNFFQRTYITMRIVIFILLISGCGTMARSQITAAGVFNFKSVPPADKKSFVMMKDSSIVYGEKVVGWGTGVLNKRVLHIDGKPIPASEVLAYQNKGVYWIKVENDEVAKRMVQGRITVYTAFITTGSMTYSIDFFQKENGPLQKHVGLPELKQLLMDCPKAYNMADMSDKEYVKISKKQPYYTQTIIETYNNCGEWK